VTPADDRHDRESVQTDDEWTDQDPPELWGPSV